MARRDHASSSTVASSGRKLTLYEQLESGGLASLASMEGSWEAWEESSPQPTADKGLLVRGVFGAVVVMFLAWVVHRLPFPPFTYPGSALEHPIGVSVLAILLGMVVANVIPALDFRAGCRWVTAWCIPAAVVFLGARMDVVLLASVGWELLLAIVGLMAFTVTLSYLVGRMCGMSGRAACLLGVGTAVCGSSAILAVAPVVDADDEEVVVTVGVVNLMGLVAMFTCVGLLWFTVVEADFFGAWAGLTIHAVPQVVAAGESHGASAAAMATMVKLARVTMLAPVVLIAALWMARHSRRSGDRSVFHSKNSKLQKMGGKMGGMGARVKKPWQYVPWFVWGFVALAVGRACGWLPSLEFRPNQGEPVVVMLSDLLPGIAKWLLALSMAAIGLQVQLRPMLKAGTRAFLAGGIVWAALSGMAFFSLRYLLD